tara:strand:- start:4158 stop:4589 length:432 start_codon:yes stop_codon:yes gene_type:complete
MNFGLKTILAGTIISVPLVLGGCAEVDVEAPKTEQDLSPNKDMDDDGKKDIVFAVDYYVEKTPTWRGSYVCYKRNRGNGEFDEPRVAYFSPDHSFWYNSIDGKIPVIKVSHTREKISPYERSLLQLIDNWEDKQAAKVSDNRE